MQRETSKKAISTQPLIKFRLRGSPITSATNWIRGAGKMKLYEVRTKNSESDWHGQTRFVASIKEASKLLRHAYQGECYTISVPDRLTQEQWIGILEADSPGRQEPTVTPVDLIDREEKPTKTKGHERPRSKNNSD